MSSPSSHHVYVILCAFFVTALVIADIIGSKLILVGPFDLAAIGLAGMVIPARILSAGIIPFPLTFVLTDLINEFYGKKGAQFITLVGLGMAIFAVALLYAARLLPAHPDSPIPQASFEIVFGLSTRMFIASLCAYLLGQFLDIQVFHFLRRISQEKMLWLRATGSTVVSQLIDSLVVAFIAFGGKLPSAQIMEIAVNNYGVKFFIAVALTPVCYLGHFVIYRFIQTRKVAASGSEALN